MPFSFQFDLHKLRVFHFVFAYFLSFSLIKHFSDPYKDNKLRPFKQGDNIVFTIWLQ